MKYLFAGAMVAFALFATAPQSASAAVYAAHLRMEAKDGGGFDLSYRLNEEANQGVTVNIMGPAPSTNVVRTFTFASQPAGPHTIEWDGTDNSSAPVPNGTYTWEVVASTNVAGSEEYVQTGFGTDWEHTFYAPYSLDFNTNPQSPHFGELYVTNLTFANETGTVAANGRVMTHGIYILSNDLRDITGQGDTAYNGGVAWVNGPSPYRVHVAEDDSVFLTDWSDSNSGVYIMNPSDPTEPFSELFDSTGRDSSGVTVNHGSIGSVHVEGIGEDRVMYAYDEDYLGDGTAARAGSLWAHNIGTATSGWTEVPTIVYDDAAHGNKIINFSGMAVKDTHPDRTGWWISQNRWEENATNPGLIHFDGETVDWNSAVDAPGTVFYLNSQASIDVTADGNRLAMAGYQYIAVLDISDLSNVSEIFIHGGTNTSHREIKFDAAGNMALSSNNAEVIVYYSKTGSNSFTTPNPVGHALVVGASSVDNWGIY